MSDGPHLYPAVTATPTESRVGSFDGRRSLLDAADSEISSIDTLPTVPASELGNDSILEDDAGSMRSTSSASSHGVAYITEYPTLDLATTSAVLYYCKKRFLRPYLRLLAFLGWRPWSESTTFRCVGFLNKAYFLLFLSLLVLGCALQYCACYRLDGELPSQHFFFQSPVVVSNATNSSGLFANGVLGGLVRRQRNFGDDFPPDPNEEKCQSPSLAAFILPDILLIGAYLYFFYLMRIAENEQMETLMERAFLQTSCPTSLSNQRDMLRSLRIWLALGILWFLASSGAQLLYLASAEVRFTAISFSLFPSVHNTLEAFLILGTWLQDIVQITLITSYCLQVQLLRLSLCSLTTQVLQRQSSLENAMKDIGESEKYLDYLNRDLGISIALLLLVNISRFASGSVWFLISDVSLIPGAVLASAIIMVILWGILFLMPLVQACRLTATYNAVRDLGHKVRERPFGFQTVAPAEMDSFLLYTSSLKHRAKIVCLPVTAGFVCFLLGFLVVVALTMLQEDYFFESLVIFEDFSAQSNQNKYPTMSTFTWEAEITCENCVAKLKDALATLGDKIESSDVDAEAKTVTVTTSLSQEEVEAALKEAGKELKLKA